MDAPIVSITTNAPLVAKNLENLAAEEIQISRSRIWGVAQSIIWKMQRRPAPRIEYPIQWDSVKQMKAYFATDGFGGGIPSVRTGAYQAGYGEPVRLEDGYAIQNNAPGAIYVGGDAYGNHQSRMHKGRWPLLKTATDEEIEKLPPQIRDDILQSARKRGFE